MTQGYFHAQPFPYAALAMIPKDDIESVRGSIEDHIQQTYGSISDITDETKDDIRDDIKHVIELEVARASFITNKDEVEEQLKQYYLN